MVAGKTDSDWLRAFVARLNPNDMSEIDFDDAAARMSGLAARLASDETIRDDYALLRVDYQGRIAGMIKAMAAVERSTDAIGAAAQVIDDLPNLPADQLVQLYRRTTVRFRDHFPTSYGPRTTISTRTLPASAVKLFR